jgi:hypothetical protein
MNFTKRYKGVVNLPDEELDKLGDYFVKYHIRDIYKISFVHFVEKVRRGEWEVYL